MTINNLDKQQNLTELTETEKNRDYYWERLMIVANSIGAIIITVICVIGITLLLKDIFG
jgi:hypothetical protein